MFIQIIPCIPQIDFIYDVSRKVYRPTVLLALCRTTLIGGHYPRVEKRRLALFQCRPPQPSSRLPHVYHVSNVHAPIKPLLTKQNIHFPNHVFTLNFLSGAIWTGRAVFGRCLAWQMGLNWMKRLVWATATGCQMKEFDAWFIIFNFHVRRSPWISLHGIVPDYWPLERV